MEHKNLELDEGRIVARYRPTIWLLLLPFGSLFFLIGGAMAAMDGLSRGAFIMLAVGFALLIPFVVDYRVYELTEAGVRIVRFGRARYFAFADMGRMLGLQVTEVPVMWTSGGSSRSTSYVVGDRDGHRLFRIGLSTARRRDLLRRIREGRRRCRE